MKIIIFNVVVILITFGFSVNIKAQNSNYLFYKLNGCTTEYAVLFSNRGDEMRPVDTAFRQQSGGYAFTNIGSFPAGIYTVYFNDSVFTEVIINGEDIVLEADIDNILMTMEVRSSIENSILFGYWKYAISIKDTVNQLNLRLQKMMQLSSGMETAESRIISQKIDKLNTELYDNVVKSIELYPNAFAPKLLHSFQLPSYRRFLSNPENVPYTDEMEFYKNHFFENIDFSDARLLNSKVIYVAISDYITNFGNPASTVGYSKIVDKVMSLAKQNNEVYQYCLNLFIRNFDNTIWEDVFVYLIDNYYRNSFIENSAIASYYFSKSDAIKKLKPGQIAPDFTLIDTSGKAVNMHQIKAKAKMLIFYSSDCPHCAEAMPNLINLYEQYKSLDVEFVGIAIDDDPLAWKSEIKDYGIQWISLSDLKGMSSPIVENYNIWMTPTMIILDSKNVIMKKPNSEAEIHSTLLQLLN